MKVDGVTISAGFPSGIIGIWHGLIANIPAGYVICDGNNSTPNYLNRFVKMVLNASTEQGTTGGAATVALSTAQLASHRHIIYQKGAGSDVYPAIQSSSGQGPAFHTNVCSNVGSGSAHENNPLNYASIYVMKT